MKDPLIFGQIPGTDLADGEAIERGDGLDRCAVPVDRVAVGPVVSGSR